MYMNHCRSLGFISLFLLVSLTGYCVADEAPGYLVYVQGGESAITNGSDEMYVITVKDIIPYFNITNGQKSSQIHVELLPKLTYPMNAALVLSGVDYETTVMVQVANVSFSDGNKILTLQADPLEYYEGTLLSEYNEQKSKLDPGNYGASQIVMDSPIRVAENSDNCLDDPVSCFGDLPDSDVVIKPVDPV